MPATVPVQETVEFPGVGGSTTGAGVEQVRPVDGKTEGASDTVPIKPLMPVTVIVEPAGEAALTITGI